MSDPLAWTIAFRYAESATARKALTALEEAEKERPLGLEFTVDAIGPFVNCRDESLAAERVVPYLARVLAEAGVPSRGATVSEKRPEAITWEYSGRGGGTASAIFDGLLDGNQYYGA